MKANEERVAEKETGREKIIKDKNNNWKDNGKENEDEKEKCRLRKNRNQKNAVRKYQMKFKIKLEKAM